MTLSATLGERNLLVRFMRMLFRRLPPRTSVPILRGPLAGERWILRAGVNAYWLGTYEFDKQVAFKRFIRPGWTVFDVGANAGFYTLLAAKLAGRSGRVFAFEPLARNVDFINAHLALNAVTNVTVLQVAVVDKKTTVRFEQGDHPAIGRVSLQGQAEVPGVGLDELVAAGRVSLPDAIKMDIEGGELQALLGARRILATHGPVIFLATHGPELHKQCGELLMGLGYELRAVRAGQSIETTDELIAVKPISGRISAASA